MRLPFFISPVSLISKIKNNTAMPTSFKKSFRQQKGAALVEYIILLALVAAGAILLIFFNGQTIAKAFQNASSQLKQSSRNTYADQENLPSYPPYQEPEVLDFTDDGIFADCNEAYTLGHTTSGVYRLTGKLFGPDYNAYCTMKGPAAGAYEGGWQAVTLQLEKDEVLWGTGIDPDRDPATYLKSSFSVNRSQFPQITHFVAYGSNAATAMSDIYPWTVQSGPDMIDALKADYGGLLSQMTYAALGGWLNPYSLNSGLTKRKLVRGGGGAYVTDCLGLFSTKPYDESPADGQSAYMLIISSGANFSAPIEFGYVYNSPYNAATHGACFGEDKRDTIEGPGWMLWAK